VANRFERLTCSLPMPLPRGRALVTRAIVLLAGYIIFAGVLWALFRYAVAAAFDPIWVGLAMALGGTIEESTAYMAGYLGGPVTRAQPQGMLEQRDGCAATGPGRCCWCPWSP
jgi:hypothetical protein